MGDRLEGHKGCVEHQSGSCGFLVIGDGGQTRPGLREGGGGHIPDALWRQNQQDGMEEEGRERKESKGGDAKTRN